MKNVVEDVIISIINIFTLYRHHKLIERFIIHKLDVWCKLQRSCDTTTSTSIWKKIDTMIKQ